MLEIASDIQRLCVLGALAEAGLDLAACTSSAP